jgi:hypothetical protein
VPTTVAPRPSAAQIAALTPPDRNRYADLLRLGSLLVVVVGHWLMAAVTVADGQLIGENVLVARPWSRWLTWVFQVMPVFFFVGGYANATGWASARGRGVGYVAWLRARAARLLRPAVPVVALWVPLAGVLALAGVPDDVLRLGTGTVMIPLWFLAVYIVIVALTPVTVWLHERYGVAALAGLVVTAAVVDAAHLAGVPLVGWSNFIWVWAAVHQLGYLWRDGALTRTRWTTPALTAAGFGALMALTMLLGYPVSMLGVDGAARTNNAPPSLALVALGVGQVGLLLMVRGVAERWLARVRVWAAVVTAGSVAMTLYLWHMTAMVAGIGIAYGLGLLPATAFDGTWWSTRPVWVAFLVVLLAPLVALFRRYERAGAVAAVRTRPETVALSVAGVAGVCAGLGLLILGGVHVPTAPLGVPVGAIGALAGGLAALGVVRVRRS